MKYFEISSKCFLKRRGLTLTELFTATVIVSIVLMGLGVAALSLRKMDASFTRDTALYMNLAALGEDIRYSAMKAVGTREHPGILLGNGSYDLCFQLGQGQWKCYSRLKDKPATELYSCMLPSPGSCSKAIKQIYVGNVVSDVFSGHYCDKPSFDIAPGARDHNFRFKLISRQNPGAGVAPATTPEPCLQPLNKGTQNNPQEVLEYTVYPEAHSF